MISPAFVDNVTAKTDIAELAAEFTELIPKGNSLAGPCPLHGGTGATFTVSPDKQVYKCFKGGSGGNAIKLVMNVQKCSFPEAVVFLAKR
ncbi:DNA primase [Mucilaginibacter paludis DSM 18603]|uniref:DNA primase n=2 Tax=Mucilaginibacter TaxID=423349 RepID=H1Y3I0_9SPHI|nr:DNA primase [Mucilaginibacter paludis DSM 18603]